MKLYWQRTWLQQNNRINDKKVDIAKLIGAENIKASKILTILQFLEALLLSDMEKKVIWTISAISV